MGNYRLAQRNEKGNKRAAVSKKICIVCSLHAAMVSKRQRVSIVWLRLSYGVCGYRKQRGKGDSDSIMHLICFRWLLLLYGLRTRQWNKLVENSAQGKQADKAHIRTDKEKLTKK